MAFLDIALGFMAVFACESPRITTFFSEYNLLKPEHKLKSKMQVQNINM
jgi:hypothetical protein